MSYKNLILEKEDGVAVIRMNRPDALNALNSDTFHELNAAFDELEKEGGIGVVIVTGEGKAFVAGADIVEMKDMDGQQSRAFSTLGQQVFRRMETMEQIFIGAVNGFALGGGCEYAMACDLRIASEKAKFGQPEVKVGVFAPVAAAIFPRLMAPKKALELLLSGDTIKAPEARELGLLP